nr:choice-of-anchor G family protein [Kineococcus aurantiacus]
MDCTALGRYSSASQARTTTGRLLGRDLSPLVGLAGVSATNPGTGASAVPATAPRAGTDAYRDNLTVTALDAALTTDLTGTVAFPLAGTHLGAYGQYARAGSDGRAVAAAGLVSDSGALTVGSATPAGDVATLDLAKLAPTTAALAGVSLGVGAVGARAALDGCQPAGAAVTPERSYTIASLAVRAGVPAVRTVGTTLTTQLGAVSTTVDALGVSLQSTLRTVVGPLLGGTAGASSATVTVDLAALGTALLATPLSDGVVNVDLRTGLVTVDLAALLSGSGGLNGRAPDTQLLLTGLTTVPARVTALLTAWQAQVQQRLTATLNAAAVELRTTVAPLGLGPTRAVVVTSTLGELAQGRGTVGVDGAVASGALLTTVATPLLAALGTVVTTTLFATPGGAVPGLVAALTPVVAAAGPALTPVVTALTSVLTLTVNAQDSPTGGTHRVSALRVGVLAPAPTDLRLATAVVGPVTPLTP